MNEHDFTSRYLESDQQGSNIYFEEHNAAKSPQDMTVYYQVLPGHMPSRFAARSLSWLAVGAFSFATVLMAVYGWSAVSSVRSPLAESAAVLDDIIEGQSAVLELAFGEAEIQFNTARRKVADEQGTDMLSQASLFVSSLLSLGNDSTDSAFARWKADFLNAAESVARSAEPLFHVSKARLLEDGVHTGTAPLGALLAESVGEMREAESRLGASLEQLSRAAEEGVTAEEQRELSVLFPRLSLAHANMERLLERFELAAWALGAEQPRRFLFLVQDTTVPRATGGLISSFALLETAGGAVTKFELDDVYNLDGSLGTTIVPPRPLQKIATAWAVHNANWFLDFPTSAQKIVHLYEAAGGGAVDGVIAVNEQILKRLLEVSGPIAASRHEGVIVSAFNVGELTVGRTETEFVKKPDTKSIAVLSDVLSVLAGSVPDMTSVQAGAFLEALENGANHKEALVWLQDEKYQRRIMAHGWGGVVIDDDAADYLAVAVSDIGSDARVTHAPRILKETRVLEDGELESTVVVQFTEDPTYTGRGLSRYVRVYVPRGSRLIEASGNSEKQIVPHINYRAEGFIEDEDLLKVQASLTQDESSHTDVFMESGKTVFGGWVVENGGSVIYTYRLPYRASFPGEVSFVFQNQPGVKSDLQFKLVLPEGREAESKSGTAFSEEFVSDKLFTVQLK